MALRGFVSRLRQFSTSRSQSLACLQHVATRIRLLSVSSTSQAGSGHPTSCASISELLSVLFFSPSGLHYLPLSPTSPANDRLVLSKGHAAPALYAAWSLAGLYPETRLSSLRKVDSDLEGHPTPRLDFIDVATGSLGQGINAACGIAYSMKYLEKHVSGKVFVIMGDGECGEGSIWEGLNFASIYHLDNLIIIVDVNKFGQSGMTPFGHNIGEYEARMKAFGCHTLEIDGHDVGAIETALEKARGLQGKPVCILAKTVKGKGLGEAEGKGDWHGKPLGSNTDKVIQQLKSSLPPSISIPTPTSPTQHPVISHKIHSQITLPMGDFKGPVATRTAYGQALVAAGRLNPLIVALDGDTRNSTMSNGFLSVFPERFIECYIAEQNMVGVALGLSKRGYVPFASTFGAFFTRAYDHIRMAALSQGNLKLTGSHCGVSIGEDGGSQMGLEDIAMMRALPGSVILYPSDAYSAYKAVELAANHPGLCYIRTSRPSAPLLYSPNETFKFGQCKVIRSSPADTITIVAGGVTLTEALKAHSQLASLGISVRVIDLFSVKPIDSVGLIENAKQTNNRILTVEDHHIEGGIRDAVSSAVSPEGISVYGLGIQEIPHSGTSEELLDRYGVSARRITEKVRTLRI